MKSLKQFFEYLNDVNFKYCVLRNWNNLPESVELGEHSDLDLLVYDLTHWTEIIPDAVRTHPAPRVQFKVPIGDSFINVDVRYIGDKYYPKAFEIDILNNRVYNDKGFFTPDDLRHKVALAYHSVHHKGSNNYKDILGDIEVKDLLSAIKESGIGYTEPLDYSVGRYNQYFKGATSTVEKDGTNVIKKQNSYEEFSLIDNESRILSLLKSNHFPKLISKDEFGLVMEDCGEGITEHNIPDNWKEQIKEIIKELRVVEVNHNDIKIDNLMVKDGVIKLIDFGWSTLVGEDTSHFPSCLGKPNRSPYGLSDNYSMKIVLKQLQFLSNTKRENKGGDSE